MHVLMGMAMTGIFEPWLSPMPGATWRITFAIAAAWFACRAIRGRVLRQTQPRLVRAPATAIECAAGAPAT